MREFITGYQLLFAQNDKKSSSIKKTYSPQQTQECIYAVRYGQDELHDYLFEVYIGYGAGGMVSFHEKLAYSLTEPGKHTTEVVTDFNLFSLSDAMKDDSKRNLTRRTHIYWWIDIAMEDVDACHVNKYIVSFGLPNDARFRSMFSGFGNQLPTDTNGNIYAGNGFSASGCTSTVTFFCQAVWLSSVPIVHHTTQWLEALFDKCGTWEASVREYYGMRSPLYLHYTMLMHRPTPRRYRCCIVISSPLCGISLCPPAL